MANLKRKNVRKIVFGGLYLCVAVLCLAGAVTQAQGQKIVWSDQENTLRKQVGTLRNLSEAERASATKQLAIQIRQLPVASNPNKVLLSNFLANLSTEGDLGHDTLQEVATTLADSLREKPVPASSNGASEPYLELAQLVRYEHVQAALDDPQYAAAVSAIEADDIRHQKADFTLSDLDGKKWTLKGLHGKIVLVNFWATWCPPCRSEMPALDALYKRFKDQGFVVLAISDEDAGKVKPFIEQTKYSYPILLDPGRKVNDGFNIQGIPKSFVYDRDGKLVAQAIDMRTSKQFLEMLAAAGLR